MWKFELCDKSDKTFLKARENYAHNWIKVEDNFLNLIKSSLYTENKKKVWVIHNQDSCFLT